MKDIELIEQTEINVERRKGVIEHNLHHLGAQALEFLKVDSKEQAVKALEIKGRLAIYGQTGLDWREDTQDTEESD